MPFLGLFATEPEAALLAGSGKAAAGRLAKLLDAEAKPGKLGPVSEELVARLRDSSADWLGTVQEAPGALFGTLPECQAAVSLCARGVGTILPSDEGPPADAQPETAAQALSLLGQVAGEVRRALSRLPPGAADAALEQRCGFLAALGEAAPRLCARARTESSLDRVVRVLGAADPVLTGLVFELGSGARLGSFLDGRGRPLDLYDDAGLKAHGGVWESLRDNEAVVSVAGHHFRAKFLAWDVDFVTSTGRTIHMGDGPPDRRGAAFRFEAGQQQEVEQLKFRNGGCEAVLRNIPKVTVAKRMMFAAAWLAEQSNKALEVQPEEAHLDERTRDMFARMRRQDQHSFASQPGMGRMTTPIGGGEVDEWGRLVTPGVVAPQADMAGTRGMDDEPALLPEVQRDPATAAEADFGSLQPLRSPARSDGTPQAQVSGGFARLTSDQSHQSGEGSFSRRRQTSQESHFSTTSNRSEQADAFQRMYTPQIQRPANKEKETVTRRYFQHVSRLAGACGPAVRGLIFELSDGSRTGTLLNRDRAETDICDDDELKDHDAWWEPLEDYERIVSVSGHRYSERFLAYDLTLVTSAGRSLRFGGPASDPFYSSWRGKSFHYRSVAAGLGEVRSVNFEDGLCVGVDEAGAEADVNGADARDGQREGMLRALEAQAGGGAWELGVAQGLRCLALRSAAGGAGPTLGA